MSVSPLELEDYGNFATGPSVIDLEEIIYVSKVRKDVRARDHTRYWYLEFQMHGVSEIRKIECVEKRTKKWLFFVRDPEPSGKIYQLQEFLAHYAEINLQK
jgi:hypothetical protein